MLFAKYLSNCKGLAKRVMYILWVIWQSRIEKHDAHQVISYFFLFMMTAELDDKKKGAGDPESVELNCGLLSSESLQLDKVLLQTGSAPSTGSYPRTTTLSPVSSCAPLSHNGRISHDRSSPESILSILRSAARSFKNTPSIIRKRSSTSRAETFGDTKSVEKRLEYAFNIGCDSDGKRFGDS